MVLMDVEDLLQRRRITSDVNCECSLVFGMAHFGESLRSFI